MSRVHFVDALSIVAVLALTLGTLPHRDFQVPLRASAPLPAPRPIGPPRYDAVPLRLPTRFVGSIHETISTNGRYVALVEFTKDASSGHVLLWKRSDDHFHGTFLDVETLDNPFDAIPLSVNDAGIAVGVRSSFADEQQYAVVWNYETQSVTKLFPDDSASIADKIDNAGNIYGDRKEKGSRFWRAYRRDAQGNVIYFDGDTQRRSAFIAMNERGQVLLDVGKDEEHSHVVLWENNQMRELNTFPQPAADPDMLPEFCGAPTVLTEDGQMMGRAESTLLLWKNRNPVQLDTPRYDMAKPVTITRNGDIIGAGITAALTGRITAIGAPFIIRNGKFYSTADLLGNGNNRSITISTQLNATTTDGVILGTGEDGQPYFLAPK